MTIIKLADCSCFDDHVVLQDGRNVPLVNPITRGLYVLDKYAATLDAEYGGPELKTRSARRIRPN
jgi:hypothetical protein